MKTPNTDNHRQLKPTEPIRLRDIAKSEDMDDIKVVYPTTVGDTPETWPGWTFWRRKHTKKSVNLRQRHPTIEPAFAMKGPVMRPVAIVEFNYYSGCTHQVVVVKMDDTYLKGLDIVDTVANKRKYQFKSFLLGRIDGPILLVHFGPINDFKG
jgi:hypothetical protein